MDGRSVQLSLPTAPRAWRSILMALVGASLFLLGLRGLPTALETGAASTGGGPTAPEAQQGFRPMLEQLEQSEPLQAAGPAAARSPATDYRERWKLERLLAPAVQGEASVVPNRPVRMAIPDISLNAPVVSAALLPAESEQEGVYQWTAPEFFAAGWHHDSAQLGESGNVVFNGHHNAYGEVFRDLDQLQQGDRIFVYGNENSAAHRYEVTRVLIFRERFESLEARAQNARWIQQTDDERLTLVTCWPYESNTHRLIVVAKPLDAGVGGGYLELE